MPAHERSLGITDTYRARLQAVRRNAQAGASQMWNRYVTVADLEQGFGLWLLGATSLTIRAQAQAAQLSDLYVAAYVSSELAKTVDPLGIDVTAFAGATQYGRPIPELLAPSLLTVKAAIGADKPPDTALAMGRNRAVRNVGVEADGAGRAALDTVLDDSPHVRGWRRVTGLAPCGACIAAATGAIQDTEETMLVHPHCSCSKEPVVAGAGDRVRRPTGSEMFHSMSETQQNDLFAGRGGEAKADLIRSGQASLSDLITQNDQASGQTIFTETPLEALRKG